MELNAQEQLVLYVVLNRNEKNEARTFPMSTLPTALSAMKKLNEASSVKDGKVEFKPEAEIDFGTDEKKLLKDSLEREWDLSVAESVLSLKTKLA